MSIATRPRLGILRAGGVVILAVLGLLAAACSGGPVKVDDPQPPDTAVAQACGKLMDKLPDEVLGEDARDIEPSDALAAAWGDPAIVLRCGIGKPSALEPTSQCLVVNDVGWFATQEGKAADLTSPPKETVDFTTIGRTAYIELSVPDKYEPQADALVDVAAAINAATDYSHPCL